MAKKLGDYVKLRMANQPAESDSVTVARDEETEAEWEAKKADLAKRGYDIVEDLSSKPSRPVDLVKLRMASQPAESDSVTVERATETEAEWEAKKADLAKRGYDIVEERSYKKDPETEETDSYKKDPETEETDSYKKDPETVEERSYKKDPETDDTELARQEAVVKRDMDARNAQREAEGPIQASKPASLDSTKNRRSDSTEPKRYGNDAASAAALEEAGNPVPEPGVLDGLGDAVETTVKGLGGAANKALSVVTNPTSALQSALTPEPGGAVERVLTPGDVAPGQDAPNEQQLAARQDLGEPSNPAQPPQFGSQLSPQPGSASMQVSSRTKSGVGAPAAAPYQTPPDMETGARMAMDAVRLQADVDKNRTSLELSQQEEKMRGAARLEEQRQAAFNAYEQRMSDGESAIKGMMAERRALMKQGVDPGRYWANKSAGAKFAAILAGAAFGWVGQGMQWLNHLDKLVNDDVKLQQDELARKGGILDDLLGDQKNLVAMGRQRGLDDLASVEAAKATMYEQAKLGFEHIATSSKNEGVKANTMANIAAIQMEQDKRNQLAMEHQKRDANEKSQIAQGWAKLRQTEEYNQMKIAQSTAKSVAGKPLQEAGVKRLDSYYQNLRAIQQMRELAENKGWFDRVTRGAEEDLPVFNPDEAGKKNQFQALKNNWMTNAARGALQREEVTRLEPLLGERSSAVDAVPGLQEAERIALEQLNTALESETAAGHDVTRFMRLRDEMLRKNGSTPLKSERKVK